MKKIISLFLVAVMLVTSVPFAAAQDTSVSGNNADVDQDVSYSGTNALGDVLAEAISESEEDSVENEENYHIETVEISGLYASVQLYAPDNATVIVAVYDETTGEMVTSGKISVSSDEQMATVELAQCEMPEYFTVKAFLLDAENAPLCSGFESIEYTEAFQVFLSQTVEDFDEEKVINLDSSTDNNFAVVHDSAVVVEAAENVNTVVTDDYENGIYVIENANEQITSLKAGDVFYYVYGDGAEDYILAKIAEVSNDNGTVTLTADTEAEVEELFNYIKIDTDKYVPETQTYSKARLTVNTGNVSKTFNVSAETNITDLFSVKFKGSVKIDFSIKFYYSWVWFKSYYELTYKAKVTVDGDLDVAANGSKEFKPIKIIDEEVYICFGVAVEIDFNITPKVEAEVTANASLHMVITAGAKHKKSGAKEDLSQSPVTELVFNSVSGAVEISITPSFSIGLSVFKVAKASVVFAVKVSLSGKFFTVEQDEIAGNKRHECSECIDGAVTLTWSGDIKFQFGFGKKMKTALKINLFGSSKKVLDFYISFGNGNGSIEFGTGECPYVTYKTVFNVTDENGNPLNGVEISDGSNTYITDSDGKAYTYLNNGTYTVSASLTGYVADSEEYSFTVDNAKIQTDITMTEKPNTSGVLAEGAHGELIWVLYNDGELIIRGTGEMDAVPWGECWKPYADSIKTVSIRYGVYNIADSAFSDCTSLTDIIIPGSVTRIDSNAFYGCTAIEKIILPDSITEIGSSAFYGCSSLADITLPEYLENIEDSVFAECTSLKSIHIPDYAEYIQASAFYGCTALECFTVNEFNQNFSVDENGIVFNFNKTKLIAYPAGREVTEYTLPNGVASIGDYAFGGCDALKSIIIPEVSANMLEIQEYEEPGRIGDYAFSGCSGLENIVIPDSMTHICSRAFSGCESLESVALPDTMTSIYSYAFGDCTGLKNIVLPDSITVIADYAFYGCTGLEGITLPNNLVSIGRAAFYNCSGLKNIKIPDSVVSIGEYAFNHCTRLESIEIPDGVTTIGPCTFNNCTALSSISIPDSVTDIKEAVFDSTAYYNNADNWENGVLYIDKHLIAVDSDATSCEIKEGTLTVAEGAADYADKLISLSIPDSIVRIGDYAFYNCAGLVDVDIPDKAFSIGECALYCAAAQNENGAYYIGKHMVYASADITSCEIKEGTLSVADRVFNNCYSLTSVTLPEGLEHIGDYAFSNWNLTVENIPDSVTYVGAYAFYKCDKVEDIPENITYIGNYAFAGCDNLTDAVIPDSVCHIGSYAFSGCGALESITIGKNVKEIGEYAFSNCGVLAEINWNAASVTDFTEQSEVFHNIGSENENGVSVVFADTVEHIPAYLFNYDCNISGLVFGNNVKSIGDYAFYCCNISSDVILGEKTQVIGAHAFDGCNTENITLSDSLSYIGEYAFSGTDISSVVLPESLTYIGDCAFAGCEKLKNVSIGKNVESIGKFAFASESGIENISVDKDNKYYSSDSYGVLFNKDKTELIQYPSASSITQYIIPDSVKKLCDYSFVFCLNLENVLIPDGIQEIGNYSFSFCPTLTDIAIPESVTHIGEFAFVSSESLAAIKVDENNKYYSSDENGVLFNKDKTELIYYPMGNTQTEYVIPDSVSNISRFAFYGNSELKNVTIPEGITKINEMSFSGCSSLTDISIPDSVVSIEYEAFYGCSQLASVSLGRGLKGIFNYAFEDCTSLESIVIPNNVTYLGNSAFAYCSALSDVVIGNGVKHIGRYAFADCEVLKSIIIPDSMQKISEEVFYGCSSLSDITIGSKVKSIGPMAFSNCTQLKTVYFNGTQAQWDRIYIDWGNEPLSEAEIICTDTVTSASVMILAYVAEDTACTEENGVITITNAVVGNEYVIIVVKSLSAEDILDNSNLIYIDQKKAETDTLTVSFVTSEEEYNCFYAAASVPCKHNCGEGTVIAPTCTEEGYTVFLCGECQKTFIANRLSANGHSYSSEITAPTCTEQGYTTYTCTECEDSYVSDYVKETGHDYKSKVTVPSCTKQGYNTYICSVCGDSYMSDYVKETGHDYKSKVTDPSCTKQGYTTYTCSACGDSYTADYVNAKGHTGGTATCKMKAVCKICGSTYGAIDLDNHTGGTAVKNAVSATCTENGYTGDIYCKSCNKKLSDGKTIAKTGHSYKSLVTVPACTKEGFTVYTCSVCGDSYEADRLPATGHSWSKWTVSIAPTTSEDGVEVRKCGVCGIADKRIVEKLPVEKITVKETALIKTASESGNNIFSVSGLTVEELLENVTKGATLVDFSGKAVTTGKLASGMRIILTDENGTVKDSRTVIIFGDTNGDSSVSAADARITLRASVGLEQLNAWQECAANADIENGNITAADARIILRASVGLEDLSALLSNIR